MKVELYIYNEEKAYIPAIFDEITWTTERKGTPGKLEFKYRRDSKLRCVEGDAVALLVDRKKVFYGYVFKKQRSEVSTVSVTCYDQLRYLKNKDTIMYSGKKASEVVKMLADSFKLSCGTIADTGYVIPNRIENNKTLFDIIQNALDQTLLNTGCLFTLYDDFGSIALKNLENMKTNVLIDKDTFESMDYTSGIDETYNQIKLTFDNNETGKRDVYITKDSQKINQWGLLQYYDTLQEGENGAVKAEALLKLYNRKKRTLEIKGNFGSFSVRAGSQVFVNLHLGDIRLCNYMLCDKVVHKFSENRHTMDLRLIGGNFA